jgi:hypothetical protein
MEEMTQRAELELVAHSQDETLSHMYPPASQVEETPAIFRVSRVERILSQRSHPSQKGLQLSSSRIHGCSSSCSLITLPAISPVLEE